MKRKIGEENIRMRGKNEGKRRVRKGGKEGKMQMGGREKGKGKILTKRGKQKEKREK